MADPADLKHLKSSVLLESIAEQDKMLNKKLLQSG